MPKNQKAVKTTAPIRLTATLKNSIVTIIAAGLSRVSACKYAGISSRQLEHLMVADKDFEFQIRKAEEEAELYYLQRIREAAKTDKSWRAAAWWLERSRPDRYAPTKPEVLTQETVLAFVSQVMQVISQELRDDDMQLRIFDNIQQLLENLNRRVG